VSVAVEISDDLTWDYVRQRSIVQDRRLATQGYERLWRQRGRPIWTWQPPSHWAQSFEYNIADALGR